MAIRHLAAVGLSVLLTFALSSVGLAQRDGQQTRAGSYSVVIQVSPLNPGSLPNQTVTIPVPSAPAEEITEPTEEIEVAGETAELDEAYDYDADEYEWYEAISDEIDEEAEGMGPSDEMVMTEPEVMIPAPPQTITTTLPLLDEGQLPTHFLRINISDATVGALYADQQPTINVRLRNVQTGETRTLSGITPMNDVLAGPAVWQFGNNLNLAGGVYTVTVEVNGQTASFQRVVVPSNPALPMPFNMMESAP